jgi:outer membrane protein OmpA-like peptidoglycan-associated protein
MQILGVGKKPITFTLLASGLALAAACGGTTVFSGQNPVTIAGEPPPPPPPPPVEAPKPPEPPPKVVVKDNKIEITEKIQFEYNKATILPASFALLEEISTTIKKNPHIKKIAIEGHASSEGGQAHNLKLSDERAKAVMNHLVEKGGLKSEMFTAKGFGSQKPLVDDTKGTDEEKAPNREKNRRVEFNIVEQDITKKKIAQDASGKEKVLEEKTVSEKKESTEPPPPEKTGLDDKKKEKKDEKKKEEKKEEKKEKKEEPKKELK